MAFFAYSDVRIAFSDMRTTICVLRYAYCELRFVRLKVSDMHGFGESAKKKPQSTPGSNLAMSGCKNDMNQL